MSGLDGSDTLSSSEWLQVFQVKAMTGKSVLSLVCMGDEAEDILQSTNITANERKACNTIIDKLNDFSRCRIIQKSYSSKPASIANVKVN